MEELCQMITFNYIAYYYPFLYGIYEKSKKNLVISKKNRTFARFFGF